MLSQGYEVFVQNPATGKQHFLHPATIISADDEQYTIELDDTDVKIEKDSDGFIYFNVSRDFLKQAIHITSIVSNTPKLVVELKTTNKPVSAENRQTFRVSTVITERMATVNGETNCPMLDVSATGLAVATKEAYQLGNNLDIVIEHDGKSYTGLATVQSIREMPSGKIRHGLCCVNEKANKELLTGLQQVSMAVQREQLRRLSRNAS